MSVCFHSTQARGHTVADRTRHNVYVNVFWHARHGTSLVKTERRTTSVLKDDVFLLFTESVEWSPFLFLLGLCSHLIFSLVSDDNHSKGWSCLKRLLCRRNEKWIFIEFPSYSGYKTETVSLQTWMRLSPRNFFVTTTQKFPQGSSPSSHR